MANKGQKLSKPQEALLRELPRRVAEDYAPIKKLIALGLASMALPGVLSPPSYARTPAGEDWVATHPPK
jgi:hypothetical protein